MGVELTADQFKEIALRRGESVFTLAAAAGIGAQRIALLRAERDQIYMDSLAHQCRAIDGAPGGTAGIVRQGAHGRGHEYLACAFRHRASPDGPGEDTDFVITHEDYHNSKPDPEPYLLALERYRIRPDECVVVEDSERGLTAAVAAGLECLIVLGEWTADGDFRKAAKVFSSIQCVPAEVLRRISCR